MSEQFADPTRGHCEYCRRVGKHQKSCPAGDTIAVQIWRAGHHAGFQGESNVMASDETYTLGYVSGAILREFEGNPPPSEGTLASARLLALESNNADLY